jgi:hypothetical protein
MLIRWLLILSLALGFGARAVAADAGRASERLSLSSSASGASSRGPQRFLFVVDTSNLMAAQKETLRNTAYDLVADGIQGQMQGGDHFMFWAFDERTYAQQTAPLIWDPAVNHYLASQVYNFLRDQPFQKNRQTQRVFNNLNNAAKAAQNLTAILISDGQLTFEGSTFDQAINTVYQERSGAYRQAGKPFITFVIARGGEWVSWKITTVGDSWDLPGLPPLPEPRPATVAAPKSSAPEISASAKPATPGMVPPPPRPEASAPPAAVPKVANGPEVKAGEKSEPKAVAIEEPAPSVPQASEQPTRPPVSPPNETGSVVSPANIKPDPAPASASKDVSPGRVITNRSVPDIADSPEKVTALPQSPAVNSTPQTPAGAAPGFSPGSQVLGPSTQAQPESAVPVEHGGARGASEPAADGRVGKRLASPMAVMTHQPGSSVPAWKWMTLGATLLVGSLALVFIALRRRRSVPEPSLISRSINQDRKPSA